MALVIRDWKADINPVDGEGNHIVIIGREEGVISYILTLLGIDVTTTLKVSPKRVEYRSSSLAGTAQRIIPLTSLSSTYYGYHKPWQAIALAAFLSLFILAPIGLGIGQGMRSGAMSCICAGVLLLAGIAGGVLYYYLNKRMTLGFVEVSGVISGLSFKRSIIESKNIDEADARRVCDLTQAMIEVALHK